MINVEFKSVRELMKVFHSEEICIQHLEQVRWNGNVVSPFDPTSKVYVCKGNKYRCKNTGKYFNVRTQTLFDNTKVELQTWFLAIYLVTSHKKGISSLQLGRDLNVTQKTAWFMLQRIRNCFGLSEGESHDEKMGGEGELIETDESIVGGKMPNKKLSIRKKVKTGEIDPMSNKSTVLGMVSRSGELRLTRLNNKKDILPTVQQNINTDVVLITDSSSVYGGAKQTYANHFYVDHSKDEFVRDHFHTNTIEGIFSLLDRMITGIYHFVSPKHMQKYLNEFTFRYNSRKVTECFRFNMLLQQSTKRLTYQRLIK